MCITAASLLMSVMITIMRFSNGENRTKSLSAWRLTKTMFSRSWRRELVG